MQGPQIFDPTLIPALIATIKLCLEPGQASSISKATLIAVTVRNLDTLATFLSVAQSDIFVESRLTGPNICFRGTSQS